MRSNAEALLPMRAQLPKANVKLPRPPRDRAQLPRPLPHEDAVDLHRVVVAGAGDQAGEVEARDAGVVGRALAGGEPDGVGQVLRGC